MEYIEVKVALKSSRTNFISLPASVVSLLYNANINSSNVICELIWSEPTKRQPQYAYCGWSGYSSSQGFNSGDYMEIDPIFAASINLKDNSNVTINLKINDYNIAKTVELEPLTTSDWELVELNAGVLENNLLYQTRCIAQDQVIVVYPSSSTSAKLKILNFDPKDIKTKGRPPFAKIVNDTEFHIKPKVPKKEETKSKSKSSRKSSSNRSRSAREKLPHVLFRGIALPHEMFNEKDFENTNYEVYVNFDECIDKLQGAKYAHVSILKGPENKTKTNDDIRNLQKDQTLVDELKDATKVVAKLVHYSPSPPSHVGLSKMLAHSLGVDNAVGNLVLLETAVKPLSKKPDTLIIHPYITESEPLSSLKQINLKGDAEIDKKLKERNELLAKSKQLLDKLKANGIFNNSCMTNYTKIPSLDDELLPHGGLLEFGKIKEGWVESLDFTNLKLEIGSNLVRTNLSIDSAPAISKVVGQNDLILKMVKTLKRCNLGALLFGNSGSGKTVITNIVSNQISQAGVHIRLFNCETISMETPIEIIKKLDDCFKEISWYSPSLLILENCDALIPAEEDHGDNSNSRQISEFLVSTLLNKTMKRRKIGVLFTAKNKTSLNSILFSSHLIEEEFNLRAPNKELRRSIMQQLISNLGLSAGDDEFLGDVSVETEGYLPGDLKTLVDRAHYHLMSASVENGTEIDSFTRAHFDAALKGFTPSLLRGVKLQKSTVKWEDIGGLRDAKSILLETLEWPTKYAPIFNNCPLRLRSGILLYGYPGCGKTLLASAVASQCGLNFISIKGPEILNKYIGASEQSVRELFDRAQAAKPCILFFDEFDSIAPKRGHDSTGVTDRVVNQMLTQMDGAEGLDGVYVLAATSRPDLIDSALLRPGRLDKSVICDIPDYEDRLDILQCITKKMDLEDDVDINIIAEQTEGYSGADLQALGYNAYLLGVHERLEADENSPKEVGQDTKNVEFFQLNNITKNFKLSFKDLKPAERIELSKKLELIFNNEDSKAEAKRQAANKQDAKIIIRHEHFLQSLKDTKPSISIKEKLKLSNIYNQFLNPNEREGNMPDGMASSDIGGRTTLM